MKVAILGATKGMGRALARQMAARGDHLCLLGRSPEELERSSADLAERGAGSVSTARCDLEDPSSFAEALDTATEALGELEVVVVTAGMFGTQEALAEDLERAHRVLVVNYANTVIFCEHARQRLLARGGGTLCVFSSVAGDRGRKPVALYGSSKAGLSHYLESLDHRHRAEGLITICVKPGFVKTSMTEGLKPPPFAGEPESVAAQVLEAIDRGTPMVYAPPIWGWIMLIIRSLPRSVMRVVGF
ncbi:MAG TPA: SDR family NAD(P)-dependent oxidoreductase [Deltaproteobacteria bacterium]|nr:SDR family NAD(P)-dependent oxidoreductase [Deltaproteobacteria bacterium]